MVLSLDDLTGLVRRSQEAENEVHAAGSLWSFSTAPFSDGVLVRTENLRNILATYGSGPNLGNPTLPIRNDEIMEGKRYCHVEAGIKLFELMYSLTRVFLGLATFGGAPGQSVAGAVSTGTHGGDLRRPPLADWIKALHLVGPQGEGVWLERSAPRHLTTDDQAVRASTGVARVIRDTTVFDAALVSCGRLGVIYAAVLEVVPIYYLRASRIETWWPALAAAAAISPAELFRSLRVDSRPLHFVQILKTLDVGDSRCWVERRVLAQDTSESAPPPEPQEALIGLDLVLAGKAHLAQVLQGDPADLGRRLNDVSASDLRWLQQFLIPKYNVPHEWQQVYYKFPRFGPLRVQSAEFALDASRRDYLDFIDDILSLASSPTIPGVLAVRYTPASQATLGMQRWETTAHVEVTVPRWFRLIPEFFDQLERLAIRYRALPHWGQKNELEAATIEQLWGGQIVQWRRAIRTLVRGGRRLFSNEFTRRKGLEPVRRDGLLLGV